MQAHVDRLSNTQIILNPLWVRILQVMAAKSGPDNRKRFKMITCHINRTKLVWTQIYRLTD